MATTEEKQFLLRSLPANAKGTVDQHSAFIKGYKTVQVPEVQVDGRLNSTSIDHEVVESSLTSATPEVSQSLLSLNKVRIIGREKRPHTSLAGRL